MPVPATVVVPVRGGVGIAIVVGIALSVIVTSSASPPYSSASAISSPLPPLSPTSSALVLWPSAVLFAPEVGPGVCVVHPAGSLLLRSHLSLVASTLFAHLLLNVMWFPLQFGRLYCVWLQREPCLTVPPTMLHLWVLVRCGPEQSISKM